MSPATSGEPAPAADLDAAARPFAGARVLITGGLGFIGSSLALPLARAGAEVTLVDAMIPGYGGNLFNVQPGRARMRVNFCDIRDPHAMDYLVQGQDFIFHCAAQVCHIMSLSDPFPDIDINIKGTAVLLEACKKSNRRVRIAKLGTRGQYGPSVKLPMSEDDPTNPKGIYEVSLLAAEKIAKVYNDVHGIKATLFRLTNIYGPRAQMRHSRFGVANWFVRLAVDDQTIEVFGDGLIKRDFVYIDDCVAAILQATSSDATVGEILNVGDDRPSCFRELAETVIRVAGSGRWAFAPFSPERAAQEPGDFYSDISRIRRRVGWEPRTPLDEGLRRTVDFYRAHKAEYWSTTE
jgi:UDP-glucose 4-epimerase